MNRLLYRNTALRVVVVALSVTLWPAASWAQPSPQSDGASPPRTAWGDPDIGGVWNNSTVTPLQRPVGQADKEFLTEEEAAEIEQRVVEGNARANAPSEVRTEPLPVGGAIGGYNSFWLDRGTTVVPTRRTSLIVDPPNGRLPALTPAAERRRSSPERLLLKDVREGLAPADSYTQFDVGDRCIWYRGVPSLPTAYNNNYLIVQTPDVVAIVQEHIHDVRFIPLDGRAHIDQASTSTRATRGATGRATPWWSRRRTSGAGPTCFCLAPTGRREAPTGISAEPSVSWSALRVSGQTRSTTSSQLRMKTRGLDPGLAHHHGRLATARCLNTRVTRATTGCPIFSPAHAWPSSKP